MAAGVQPIARAIGGAIARGSHFADLGVVEGDRSARVDALGPRGIFPAFRRSLTKPSSISATMPNTVRIILRMGPAVVISGSRTRR
jgi:hypothetical protein